MNALIELKTDHGEQASVRVPAEEGNEAVEDKLLYDARPKPNPHLESSSRAWLSLCAIKPQ